MQQAQRAEYNHALEHAIARANELDQPVLVGFGLMDDYPEANLRHYKFMLEGIKEAQESLDKRGITMVVCQGSPDDVALGLGKQASLIVCDRGYLRHQKAWREQVAKDANCRVEQVESDVIVPIETVSDKAEYAARTIRPKIHKKLEKFLIGITSVKPKIKQARLDKIKAIDLSDIQAVLENLNIDRSVTSVGRFFRGGTQAAKATFRSFIDNGLKNYKENRNQPHTNDVSHMSPYLHFGQISPLYLALEIYKKNAGENAKAYLDELIVRRELAMNFVNYTPDYDCFASVPDWAKATLDAHKKDEREYHYTHEQLEAAETHDRYWNTAMKELTVSGYMHNYMWMYWGKKILEWSVSPEMGFKNTLAIMNKYFLDGRDCNSYANTAWVYGLHNRAWQERPVFGKVRYQSASGLERKKASGLERKNDMQSYLDRVARVAEA
jgi:deoxyribodipyrimidine photo-lyase